MPINTLGECPKGWTTTQFVVVVDLGDRNRALWLVLVRELGPEVEEDEYYGSHLPASPKVEMGWEECKKALGQTCSQLETVLPISRTNAGEEPKIFDCARLTEKFGDWCSGTASTMAQQIRKTAGARNPQLFRTPGEDILLPNVVAEGYIPTLEPVFLVWLRNHRRANEARSYPGWGIYSGVVHIRGNFGFDLDGVKFDGARTN
ncbi:hypothetical protein INS49_006583 [Diaporthe citri]|uniref:uncharacterized protein n=1 Tax=Diaporthe citri TaxID=83186 RepID=UPI001C81BFEC|nr:uncharacterized protein INS49_006583 [Diaporthe citri]KAG6364978.1 hypothetical protein INS49_006583 [Diaporthe citri]